MNHPKDDNFKITSQNGWTLLIDSRFSLPQTIEQLIPDFSALPDNFQKVDSSVFAQVFKYCIKNQNSQCSIYLKRFLDRSLLDKLKHIFRPSRAQRSFTGSMILKNNGFDCPEIIALGLKKKNFITSDSFITTLEVENSVDLYNFFHNYNNGLKYKRDFLRTLGRIIGKMHAAGIFHGDL
ncbi:MAG: lipopolysaccharide kinase InaA family protein, partial [Phycisphaerae bacterium]|nr:lipopolysaccharide kinase InaA family protein [Phycisphaerae bacterium]